MNTIPSQLLTIRFEGESDADASSLAEELQSLLRAEGIPAERQRANPNSMNLGELIGFEMPIAFAVAVVAHTITEFTMRLKAEPVIERSDGMKITLKGASLTPHHKQTLEEFLRLPFSKPAGPPTPEEDKGEENVPIR